jgi:hypothetical protein
MNQPKPQCPSQEKILLSNILDHQRSAFDLHPIQVGLPKVSLGKADRELFNVLPIHSNPPELPSISLIQIQDKKIKS